MSTASRHTLVLATRNKGKLAEFSSLFEGLGVNLVSASEVLGRDHEVGRVDRAAGRAAGAAVHLDERAPRGLDRAGELLGERGERRRSIGDRCHRDLLWKPRYARRPRRTPAERLGDSEGSYAPLRVT